MRFTSKDVSTRRTFQGAWECSAMVGDCRIHKQYFGRTKREAIREFVRENRHERAIRIIVDIQRNGQWIHLVRGKLAVPSTIKELTDSLVAIGKRCEPITIDITGTALVRVF